MRDIKPETILDDYRTSISKSSWNQTRVNISEEFLTSKAFQWTMFSRSVICHPSTKLAVKETDYEYNPRSEVVIDKAFTEEFIEMVDNPKLNKKMAKLLEEAKEMFPDEWEVM